MPSALLAALVAAAALQDPSPAAVQAAVEPAPAPGPQATPPPGPAAACAPGKVLLLDGLGTPSDELARVGELTGDVPLAPGLLRRGGLRVRALCGDGAGLGWARRVAVDDPGDRWVRAVPLRLAGAFNSRHPSGGNDGLLWEGRGFSTQAQGGVAFRYGPLSGALAPEVAWQQNAWFEIVPTGNAGRTQWANAFYPHAIDLPQRFGAGPFASFAGGQSFLRLDAFGVAVGLSTENLWMGPGVESSILMSNTAPGFPHVFLETARPVDIWIGKLEAQATWGRLASSRYTDDRGNPLFITFALDYEPRWIPGLYLGLGRVFLQPWGVRRFRDYVPFFESFFKGDLRGWYGPSMDNPNDNQLAALWFRWVFPAVGLELYGEWGREDHEMNLQRLLKNFDDNQSTVLGLQKVFRAGPRLVRASIELTDLQQIRPLDAQRGMPVYYIHGAGLDYTNRGQLIGDWIGPGGDSQRFAVDVLGEGGRLGGYLQRVRRNNAVYWRQVEPVNVAGQDVEVAAGARQVLFAGPAEVSWDLSMAWRYTRDFLRDEPNLRAVVQVGWPVGAGGGR